MGDKPASPANWLGKDAPSELRDFLSCTTTAVTLKNGKLTWLGAPVTPSLTIVPDESDQSKGTLKVGYGPVGVSLPASVDPNGKLTIDTSGIPPLSDDLKAAKDAIDRFTGQVNDFFAANKNQLGSPIFIDGQVHLSKVPLVAAQPQATTPQPQTMTPQSPGVTPAQPQKMATSTASSEPEAHEDPAIHVGGSTVPPPALPRSEVVAPPGSQPNPPFNPPPKPTMTEETHRFLHDLRERRAAGRPVPDGWRRRDDARSSQGQRDPVQDLQPPKLPTEKEMAPVPPRSGDVAAVAPTPTTDAGGSGAAEGDGTVTLVSVEASNYTFGSPPQVVQKPSPIVQALLNPGFLIVLAAAALIGVLSGSLVGNAGIFTAGAQATPSHRPGILVSASPGANGSPAASGPLGSPGASPQGSSGASQAPTTGPSAAPSPALDLSRIGWTMLLQASSDQVDFHCRILVRADVQFQALGSSPEEDQALIDAVVGKTAIVDMSGPGLPHEISVPITVQGGNYADFGDITKATQGATYQETLVSAAGIPLGLKSQTFVNPCDK